MLFDQDGICISPTGCYLIGGVERVIDALERGKLSEVEDELDARENQDGQTIDGTDTGAIIGWSVCGEFFQSKTEAEAVADWLNSIQCHQEDVVVEPVYEENDS